MIEQNQPPPDTLICRHEWKTHRKSITVRTRVKFGFVWILVTVVTGGIGFLAWLVWPRKKTVVAIDRWSVCQNCGEVR